jgi:hypothetical protein
MKSDRFKQLKLEFMTEHIFITGFCSHYMMVSLIQNLQHFLLMEPGSIWMSITMLRTTGIRAVLAWAKFFKYLYNHKIGVWYAITITWKVGAIFFLTDC